MLQHEMEQAIQELKRVAAMVEALKNQEQVVKTRRPGARKKWPDEYDEADMVHAGNNLIHRDIYKMYGNPTVREIKTELQKRHWEFDEDRDGNIHLVFRNDYYITNRMTETELQGLLLDIKISC